MTASIATFQELYNLAQRYRKGRWVFRGVPDSRFEPVPKICRFPVESKNERRIFEFFKREALCHLQSRPENDWEWLCLAQHHGLPTRLLDWSENMLVSAYFASQPGSAVDGAIYVLKLEKVASDTSVSPFDVDGVCRYRPAFISRRVAAQRGLFTIHPAPYNQLALPPAADNVFHIHKIFVKEAFKEKLRWNISRFGINSSSLFPDLDGLSSHVQWMFSSNDPSEEDALD